MKHGELKEFLEAKVSRFNQLSFIDSDPIQVPHCYSLPADIEIAAFLTATIAWGQRQTIIKNARQLMQWMDNAPKNFILHFRDNDLKRFARFKHRTFTPTDCTYFLKALQNIYRKYGGLEKVFQCKYDKNQSVKESIIFFRQVFFEFAPFPRTYKHLADIRQGSSAKRINLFLRWMVRRDNRKVDFGIWNTIPMSALYLPLDVHTGSVARKLGLLDRKTNDWKAVEKVTAALSELDPEDPVKYDYALFGLGAFENF